jgi:hypothetical protein
VPADATTLAGALGGLDRLLVGALSLSEHQLGEQKPPTTTLEDPALERDRLHARSGTADGLRRIPAQTGEEPWQR